MTEAQIRYRQSEKYRATRKRYRQTPKGKESMRNYNARYNKGTQLMAEVSKARPCTDCGQRHPAQLMEYDHRPDESKVDDIARLARKKKPSVVFAEIAKCDLVCANCHRYRTLARYLDERVPTQNPAPIQ